MGPEEATPFLGRHTPRQGAYTICTLGIRTRLTPSQGQVEQGLCEIADADQTKRFFVYCARPSGILPPDAGLASKLAGKLYEAIDVDHLAKAFIRVLLEGHKERIIESNELLAL
jgi:hypothetical protein